MQTCSPFTKSHFEPCLSPSRPGFSIPIHLSAIPTFLFPFPALRSPVSLSWFCRWFSRVFCLWIVWHYLLRTGIIYCTSTTLAQVAVSTLSQQIFGVWNFFRILISRFFEQFTTFRGILISQFHQNTRICEFLVSR